ncbi:MAG: metalloregulator ArsR/SmtB family transcription factor [Reinekea sp.]|jgi:ArsR family transcriptional regulator, arsenate/arsenite/antimonite-responsive transcriptional repressor
MLSPLTFFKCLADDTRLKSILLISQKQEMCVCDLQEALQLSQPKVSRHLAELRKCDLLVDERRGKWVYYQLNPTLPDWALHVLDTAALNNQDYLSDCLKRLPSSCQNKCES